MLLRNQIQQEQKKVSIGLDNKEGADILSKRGFSETV